MSNLYNTDLIDNRCLIWVPGSGSENRSSSVDEDLTYTFGHMPLMERQ